MSRTRAPYESTRTVLDFPSPIEYVKNVLDSKSPEYKGGYETDGHVLLSSRYSNLKDEKQKKLITEAIVQLLDDSDYACDAISVAAELGLPEAKKWFLNLSKKAIEEIRQIKTNAYSNGLGCLIHFSAYFKDFLSYLKSLLLEKEDLTCGEYLITLKKIAIHDPNFIFENYKGHVEFLFASWNESMGNKKFIIYDVLCTAFENSKLEYCIEIARKMKTETSKEIQSLYYDSLQKLPAYNPYIQELKKILEIK